VEAQRAQHLQGDICKFTSLVFLVPNYSKNFKDVRRGKKLKNSIWKVIKRKESVTQTKKREELKVTVEVEGEIDN